MTGEGRQRIDKWLWFARLVKTRTLAQKLAVSGSVRINREKVEAASQLVKIGDVLTVASVRGVRILKVAAPGTRRGPAPEARLLYEDLSPAPAAPAAGAEPAPAADRPPGSGRPTKRDRRALDRLQGAVGDDFPTDDG
jgi:ribosome-associated heat shock protein Hsp15